MESFYVYVYLNPLKPGKYEYGRFYFDFEPFYIGKGSHGRIDYHIYEALRIGKKSGKKAWETKKVHTIRKIDDFGLEPIRYKIYDNLTEFSAFRFEKYFIQLIGRSDLNKGPLTNLTDGGDGIANVKWTEERRINMSNLMKLQKPNYGNLGNVYSKETKDKISKANKGKIRTNEQKALISKSTQLAMKNRIEVAVFDLEGNFIIKYPSIRSFKLEKKLYDRTKYVFKNQKFDEN
jgi:hypothetical protein